MPRLSIVTTCKGRLHHLRQSLPTFLAQPDCQVIVVDFDCPDGTAAVVEQEFPTACVVKIDDAQHFDINRARNAGGDAASGEWIAFVDADVLLAADFHARLAPLMKPGAFLRFFPRARGTSLFGTCIMQNADYRAVGRYDEAMQGYGGDDQEMYFRLQLSGLEAVALDFDLAKPLGHEDAARIQFGRNPSKLHDQRINSAYLVVKTTLLRLLGVDGVSPEQCRTLYKLVGEVVSDANRAPDAPIHFTIDLPPDPIAPPIPVWAPQRQLVFNLTPTELLGTQDDV